MVRAGDKLMRTAVVVAGLSAALSGCGSEEREARRRCDEAVAAAQEALAKSALSDARDRIDAARETCRDKQSYVVERLEKTLAAKERTARELEERQAQEALLEKVEPLVGFVQWVSSLRDGPDHAPKLTCHPREDARFGFCDADRRADALTYSLRFHKETPRAVRFTVVVETRAGCGDLGEHRVVRAWDTGDGRHRVHCEIYGGRLEGLAAVITTQEGKPTDVVVFSKEYLLKDSELRSVVEREGR
jgi:hypothetical protein